MKYSLLGLLFWGSVIAVLVAFFLIFRQQFFHANVEKTGKFQKYTTILTVLVLCLASLFLSSLSVRWTNEAPFDYTSQYEEITESFLHGHLYFEEEPSPELLAMDNPYDKNAREDQGVDYLWDHALYDGKYYMYFGVAPVFLLFLPFRIITGSALPTYHATQVFIILAIVGIFALFHLFAKKYFRKIPFGLFLLLATTFAIPSILYSLDAPSLYCTAIMSGVCLEIWSIFFFFRALWLEKISSSKRLVLMLLGAVCGALVFACRPPIAMANLLLIPFLIQFLRRRSYHFNWRTLLYIFLVMLPYVIVGILLMLYNYARFNNPFEFGQSYQLTVTDQSGYGSIFTLHNLGRGITGVISSLIGFNGFDATFPFIRFGGVFVNFPILLLAVFGLTHAAVWHSLKKYHLTCFVITLIIAIFVTIFLDVVWTPFLIERYHLDIYYLCFTIDFIVIGFWYQNMSTVHRKYFYYFLAVICFCTIGFCALYYLYPYNYNLTMISPEVLDRIQRVLRLGF